MPAKVQGYVLVPGAGVGNDPATKANADSTGGVLTVIESTAGGGAPLHVHAHDDECFYVVDGAMIVRIGDEVHQAPKGAFVFLPKGTPHGWDVAGEPGALATILIITAPAGLDHFLHRFHSATTDAERDHASREHGVTFLPDDMSWTCGSAD